MFFLLQYSIMQVEELVLNIHGEAQTNCSFSSQANLSFSLAFVSHSFAVLHLGVIFPYRKDAGT